MAKMIAPEVEWPRLVTEVQRVVPEAFDSDGRVLNLLEGAWGHPGHAKPYTSPVDGTQLGTLPMLDQETASRAVTFTAAEFPAWAQTDLDERRQRVATCLQELHAHRELLAHLLMWEIGKPYRLALSDVERCISGVTWYVDGIESMLAGRTPLGVISDIASWNYPLSVLVHAVLVQVLAGNTVITKTPTDGGLYALTLALALARRCGLPVSLVSGSGSQLGEVLVRNPKIDGLAFVGGRSTGREVAASLYDRQKRYMLEMEGINAYGIWEFSDWPSLAQQLKRGFDYGKQRCTAYARYVIQRRLFPQFLETYLPVLKSLRFGNPVVVDQPGDPLPTLDFGPLINSRQVDGLRSLYEEALSGGAISLYEGTFDESLFLPDQDRSAYLAPTALINVPRGSQLYHKEPFGPVDTIVIADRIEELINEMNISNGSLVASVACDDLPLAREIAAEVRAFKVGINQMRSRGDNEEVFGGLGQSWRGCFVGGKYLVQAVTQGPPGERLYGNFVADQLLPEER
jgi:acyl-CoA reductase-like NAD-dependent aldehyde dehydrogenase